MAQNKDLWFHTKNIPGSHTIVRTNGQSEVPDSTILEAANIAAYYSSYSMSSTVPVNYTLVKNIKKIPGGKPGKVIINNQKTIYVDPDYLLFKDFILN